MIDNTEATEQPRPEIVQLGQKFQLFKPEIKLPTLRGNIEEECGPVAILESHIIPPIPISIFLAGALLRDDPNTPAFTPLNPNESYHVTNDDSNPVRRLEKIKKFRKENRIIPNAESFFHLALGNGESSRGNIDLYHTISRNKHIFKEGFLEALGKMRIQLFFPNGSYEAQPKTDYLGRDGVLYFTSFYPLDTGPLPKLPEKDQIAGDIRLHKGLPLRLPKDTRQLSQIQARFVFAQDRQNRGGEN